MNVCALKLKLVLLIFSDKQHFKVACVPLPPVAVKMHAMTCCTMFNEHCDIQFYIMHTAEGTSEYNFADCVCVGGGVIDVKARQILIAI